jgi:hypothetical protein
MQIPIELQVHTKFSGHETLGCENIDLAAEKRVKISGLIAAVCKICI